MDGSGNVWKCNRIDFVPGTTWTSGNGWKPVASDDGKFWTPNGVSATDYLGNTSCGTTTPPADITAPSTPAGLTATAISSSQINLSWAASTDNIGVTGYRVFRNGTQVGTPTGTSYSDTGLTASTAYNYAVKAVDAAGNLSAASASASATTQAASGGSTGACLASDNCYPKPVNTGIGATGIPPGHTPTAGCTQNPASGQVLQDCSFSGIVDITTTGAGATYRYSQFVGQVRHFGTGTLTVEYSDFGPASGCNNDDNAFTGSNYTVRYSRFNSHLHEGPRDAGNNILIEENFIGPLCSNPGDHADGFQGYGGGTNVRVLHNTIDERTAADVTSPIFIADFSEPIIVRDNLLAGGGYSLRLHDDFTPDHNGWEATGNRIVQNSWAYGPTYNGGTSCSAPVMTWNDNRLVTIDANYSILSLGNTVNCDGSTSGGTTPPPADTAAPSIPASLTAAAISSSQISLSWSASTDNVGVAGYRVFRGGTQIGTSATASYSDTGLTASTVYSYTVLAYDAAGNTSAQSASASATTQAAAGGGGGGGGTSYSIFTTQTPGGSYTDGVGVEYELGTQFTSTFSGQITSIRFYKSASESGTHTGRIWSSAGTQLASVVFSGETASGWQTATLATPLSISSNTTYVVSVNTGNAYYAATNNGLTSAITNGPISTVVGNNGVYGTPGTFELKKLLGG